MSFWLKHYIIRLGGGRIIKINRSQSIIIFCLLAIIIFSHPSFAADTSLLSKTLADNIEKILPAIVKVKTIQQENNEQKGAGFIISSDGYIVTSYHLIEDAQEIKVKLKGKNSFLPGKKVGIDLNLDLAILKINFPQKLTTVTLGDSDNLRPGNLAIAVGHPYHLDYTISWGIISSTQRQLTLNQDNTTQIYSNLIQTDAAINPGNSGGPLLNMEGKVVGMNTAINTEGEGISFAIPINEAKKSITQIKQHGKIIRPWLGIYLQDLSEKTKKYLDLSKDYGILLSNITPNSPADRAGLKSGDIILKFNEQKIYHSQDLIQELNKLEIGTEVTITILRETIPKTYTLTIEEQPKEISEIRN